MHLNNLYMRNFKKYREVEIEFQDGLTGIVGRNGSGKSSIVEAIAWALYGNKASIVKRDLIKNSRAGERDDLVVRLDLNLDNKEMTIERAMTIVIGINSTAICWLILLSAKSVSKTPAIS